MTEARQNFSDPASSMTLLPDSPSTTAAFRALAAVTLLITFFCLVGAALLDGRHLNSDAALFLDAAKLVLQGYFPFDFNPPITTYIHIIPIYLAHQLNFEVPTAFQIFVLTLATYSATACFFLLSKLTPVFSVSSRLLLAAVCLLFSLWVLRASTFGEREHLFALGYIPWLYCREIRHGGGTVPRWLGIVVGLIGWPLFFMKPHFFLIVALAEVWLLFISRRFSALRNPEILVVACWVLGFAVHFYFIPSDFRDALFFRWLPFSAANYDVFDSPVSEIVRQFSAKFWFFQISLVIAVLLLMLKSQLPNNWKLQIHGLTVSTLLAWGIFALQHKGWSYHLAPAISLEMLLATTLVIIALEWRESVNLFGRLQPPIRAITVVVVCLSLSVVSVGMAYARVVSTRAPDSASDFVSLIQQQVAPHEKVTFISTIPGPGDPALVYANRVPGTRFLPVLAIALLYKGVQPRADGKPPYRSPSETTSEEKWFLGELGTDILEFRPKLVFIQSDKDCEACPKGFRIEQYLAAEGWLQRYMRNYSRTQILHDFAVYVRQD
jgi:hypothetical protein